MLVDGLSNIVSALMAIIFYGGLIAVLVYIIAVAGIALVDGFMCLFNLGHWKVRTANAKALKAAVAEREAERERDRLEAERQNAEAWRAREVQRRDYRIYCLEQELGIGRVDDVPDLVSSNNATTESGDR